MLFETRVVTPILRKIKVGKTKEWITAFKLSMISNVRECHIPFKNIA